MNCGSHFHRIGPSMLLIAAFGMALGCASISGRVPAREEAERSVFFAGAQAGRSEGILAGAGKAELTPTIGYPMGGHSAMGQTSRGQFARLYARAIYLEDPDGHGCALVATDLWSMASGLADEVAELLSQPPYVARLGGRRLGREQVLLTATHTHQSPALFSSDRFFSVFAANAPGFDPDLLRFLAMRIAWAVTEAVENAEPARVLLEERRVGGAFRNRSVIPFLANAEAGQVMQESGLAECAPHPLYPDPRSCQAVDNRVRVLRVLRGSGPDEGELMAAGVFLASHPETLSHHLDVYSSDLFGAVALGAERRLQASAPQSRPAVVAIFNGAEGDISALFEDQDREDLQRIAAHLTGEVLDMASGGGREVGGEISWAFDANARLGGRWLKDELGNHRMTAWLPMTGRATAAGAEDGPSTLPGWLFYEGGPGFGLGPQGRKLGTLDVFGWLARIRLPLISLTRTALIGISPPRTVALGVYQLGPLRFATLPGEFTTVMGRRIADGVAQAAGVDRADVVLLGLAHSYGYYFATPEEYRLQHYEGSGTLFGRFSGALVAKDLTRLAGELRDAPAAGKEHRYLYLPWLSPRLQSDWGPRRIEIEPELEGQDVHDVTLRVPGDLELDFLPRACWEDALPSFPVSAAPPSAGSDGVTPRIAIQQQGSAGWRTLEIEPGIPEDDDSLRILTLGSLAQGDEERTSWCTYWIPPAQVDRSRPLRFKIMKLDGDTVVSDLALP